MNEKNNAREQAPTGVLLGLALTALAIFVLVASGEIAATGLSGNADPGPRAVPQLLAACLGAGGLVQLAQGIVRWRRSRRSSPAPATWLSRTRHWLRDAGNQRLLFLAATLLVYLIAIPRIGFTVATLFFTLAAMLRLGTRWWIAVPVAVVLLLMVELLFVRMFQVQLPEIW